MKILIYCFSFLLAINSANAQTKEEIAKKTTELETNRASLSKRKSDLEAELKKANDEIAKLNSKKTACSYTEETQTEFATCRDKLLQTNRNLKTASENAKKLEADVKTVQADMKKLDEDAAALGLEATKSAEKTAEQNKRFKLGKAFDTLRYDALALRADTADAQGKLRDFEKDIDETRLGLYTQQKLLKLLNDPVMCQVANQCKGSVKNPIGKDALRNVFPGAPLGNSAGTDRAPVTTAK